MKNFINFSDKMSLECQPDSLTKDSHSTYWFKGEFLGKQIPLSKQDEDVRKFSNYSFFTKNR